MSQRDKYDDDDYVAKLLAEDAKKTSARYAAVGLSALLPRRPTGSAPKPNTRFLKNLVREADVHNAALKKKEELEARMRLKEIRRHRHVHKEESYDSHHRKRRRLSHRDEEHDRHRDSTRTRRRRKDSVSLESEERSERRHRRHCLHRGKDATTRRSDRDEGDDYDARKHRSSDDVTDRHNKSRTTTVNRDYASRDRFSNHHRRVQSRQDRGNRETGIFGDGYGDRSDTHRRNRRRSSDSAASSDPLEDLVGPMPAKDKQPVDVQIRGRGASGPDKSTSNIDAHFSSKYDPALDQGPGSDRDDQDGDDWDMALEALRDRNQWKQKQADRMREAGWENDEIKKWDRSARDRSTGHERDMKSVKWARAGESREWDRGKDPKEWSV